MQGAPPIFFSSASGLIGTIYMFMYLVFLVACRQLLQYLTAFTLLICYSCQPLCKTAIVLKCWPSVAPFGKAPKNKLLYPRPFHLFNVDETNEENKIRKTTQTWKKNIICVIPFIYFLIIEFWNGFFYKMIWFGNENTKPQLYILPPGPSHLLEKK